MSREASEQNPLPCPFCGNAPNVRQPAGGWWFVECCKPRSSDCPAFAYTGAETKGEAIKRWNTRASDPLALVARALDIRSRLTGAAYAEAWDAWTRDAGNVIAKAEGR